MVLRFCAARSKISSLDREYFETMPTRYYIRGTNDNDISIDPDNWEPQINTRPFNHAIFDSKGD